MAKIYTKATWVDEVLAAAAKYLVKDDAGDTVYAEADISLSTEVSVAGTALTAAKMNNIETGIDALDTLLNVHALTAKTTPVDADEVAIVDSAATWARKRLSWSNIKAALAAIFVTGPASAVDGKVVLFDGTTGKLVKDSGLTLSSGVWTPTLTNIFNIASSVASEGTYLRVGNVVNCNIAIAITTTASGPATIQFMVPVLPASNFSDVTEGSGKGVSYSGYDTGALDAATSTKKMRFRFYVPDTTERTWQIDFAYKLN